jgi:hypothetical protein
MTLVDMVDSRSDEWLCVYLVIAMSTCFVESSLESKAYKSFFIPYMGIVLLRVAIHENCLNDLYGQIYLHSNQ